jgi:hypothetical protein
MLVDPVLQDCKPCGASVMDDVFGDDPDESN